MRLEVRNQVLGIRYFEVREDMIDGLEDELVNVIEITLPRRNELVHAGTLGIGKVLVVLVGGKHLINPGLMFLVNG